MNKYAQLYVEELNKQANPLMKALSSLGRGAVQFGAGAARPYVAVARGANALTIQSTRVKDILKAIHDKLINASAGKPLDSAIKTRKPPRTGANGKPVRTPGYIPGREIPGATQAGNYGLLAGLMAPPAAAVGGAAYGINELFN